MLFHYDMISVPLVYTQVSALLLGMLHGFYTICIILDDLVSHTHAHYMFYLSLEVFIFYLPCC